MNVIHVHHLGDNALIPQSELARLVETAHRYEPDHIVVQVLEPDASYAAVMLLAEEGGAFDFWNEPGENIYTSDDGEPV